MVLVADPDLDSAKAIAGALTEWGYDPVLVHDGVEAILTIQRKLPKVVVLDVGLPKMFGFQVCELIKRNESLRNIKVVLIGSVHDQDRYRRDPNEIYGADSYVERPQLPDALGPVLQGFGEAAQAPEPPSVPPEPSSVPPEPPPVAPEPPPAAPAVSPPPQPAPQVAQADGNVGEDPLAQAGGNAGEDPLAQAGGNAGEDPLAEAVAEAERLARVIVSDVILYNPEMFDAAVTAGNVVEALASELVEGRAHFAQRADPRVRDTKDFLAEALLHAARERSGA
jgi:CheY-like chemotaxis protein